MNGWISARIEKAGWRAFAIWFVVWFLYNLWAINMDSPWTRALAAGGGVLPEMKPGFSPIEPQRSLEALAAANATGDYIFWQALDIPYAILNVMTPSIAMALALRATRLTASPMRYLLLLPPIYFLCELVEDGLVAAFAAKAVAPVEGIALIQQVATTIKLATGYGSMALALISLCIAMVAAIIALFRKRA